MTKVAFECQSLGLPCEWAMRGDSAQEIVDRVREHAKCAHNMPELPTDLLAKVEAAIHPA
jgi:predicted small metal-binding protein